MQEKKTAIRKNERTLLKKVDSRSGGSMFDFDFHGVGGGVNLFDGNAYFVGHAGLAVLFFKLDGKFVEHISI